jgi:hypothetical protein
MGTTEAIPKITTAIAVAGFMRALHACVIRGVSAEGALGNPTPVILAGTAGQIAAATDILNAALERQKTMTKNEREISLGGSGKEPD